MAAASTMARKWNEDICDWNRSVTEAVPRGLFALAKERYFYRVMVIEMALSL
jgi:hypothetical protein